MGTSFRLMLVALVFTVFSLPAQENSQTIKGYVSHLGVPLVGAEISVLDSDVKVVSDIKGYYSISAFPKNTLVYSYPGMRPVEVIVEDVTKILNVSLNLEVTELEEVVVTERQLSQKEQQEIQWKYGKGIVKGAFGFLDKRSSGASIDFIEEEDILRSFDLLDAIRRVAPSARAIFNDVGIPTGISLSNKFFRFDGSRRTGFDIDGFLTLEFPFIPLDQIKRIAVVRTPIFGAYGRFASAGLIIINTKNGFTVKDGNNGEPYDYARLTNNIYTNDATQYQWYNGSKSSFLELLKETTTSIEALKLYKEYGGLYGDNQDFHFDTATYVIRKLNDKENGLEILQQVREKFNEDPNVLKATAYLLEDADYHNIANKLYERILQLRPRYAQSYRDLANSYLTVGDEKKAMAMYARYKHNFTVDKALVGSEIDSIISVETTNMVSQGKSKFLTDYKKLDLSQEWPIRVVLEWDNSEAEFDFQLVHPENQYYTWSHTLEKNKDFIAEEKTKGFSSKQFYIGADSKGNWSANLTYFGNKSFNSTYLKATVYYNYASYKERKEVFVFKLKGEDVNQTLFNMRAPARARVTAN